MKKETKTTQSSKGEKKAKKKGKFPKKILNPNYKIPKKP